MTPSASLSTSPRKGGGRSGIVQTKTGTLSTNLCRKVVIAVVKGITRQVILVKSPDPRLFEEAIFIVKEEALNREGVTTEQIMREARQAADGYLKQGKAWNRRMKKLPAPLWGAAGAAVASAGWMAWLFLL